MSGTGYLTSSEGRRFLRSYIANKYPTTRNTPTPAGNINFHDRLIPVPPEWSHDPGYFMLDTGMGDVMLMHT